MDRSKSLISSQSISPGAPLAGIYNVTPPAPQDGQAVALQVDSLGNLLVNVAVGSGGGGTQYIDGATQATPTGTVAFGKNPSNILHALGLSAAGNLNVNLAEGTISGGNAAASATGAAVPASADYVGVNIGGNLVGVTGFSLTGAKAAAVAIVDGSGNQITSFGGGTQFADNAGSGAAPTGTLSMGWDSVNSKIRALKVDASQNLEVLVANSSIPVTGTFFQATQPVSIAAAVDVSDRAARLLGHVTVDNASIAVTGTFFQATQPVSIADGQDATLGAKADAKSTATDTTAVSVMSVLKEISFMVQNPASTPVTGTFFQATQPVSIAAAVDVSDRAARLLGVVYGSQGQQLKQTATNFNLQVELATGGTLYDARQIRALTSSDVVTANQGGAPWSVLGTVTVSGTITANQGTANATPWNENVAQFGGNPVVTGVGISGAGIPRVTVSSDSFPATTAVVGPDTLGKLSATNPVQIGGVDGSGIVRQLSLDDAGNLAGAHQDMQTAIKFLNAILQAINNQNIQLNALPAVVQ